MSNFDIARYSGTYDFLMLPEKYDLHIQYYFVFFFNFIIIIIYLFLEYKNFTQTVQNDLPFFTLQISNIYSLVGLSRKMCTYSILFSVFL